MMSKLAVVLVLTALAFACSAESSELGGGSGPRQTAGAPSSGGSAGDGNTGGSGSVTITPPVCPETEPEAGSACDSTAINCPYDVCGDEPSKMFSCRQGQWVLTRACGPLDCPEERPLFLSDCAPLETLECHYVEDCCGTEPATQAVVARCEFSQWTLMGPSYEEACSFCRGHHQQETACDLPSGCENVGCYWVSCYAQPLVEECVDGVWRVQTTCSK
jgi:hypothetical protein